MRNERNENALAAVELEFSSQDIDDMIAAADLDKNNSLDLEEFKKAMRRAADKGASIRMDPETPKKEPATPKTEEAETPQEEEEPKDKV